MAIVLLAEDLMTASRVDGAARQCGIALHTVADVPGVVACCGQQPVAAVIVDLAARSGDAASLFEQFEAAGVAPPPVIAFGPHVHESRLAAAEAAGCDEVLSRGQFFGQLADRLRRLASAE